jgi:hypothetical protein
MDRRVQENVAKSEWLAEGRTSRGVGQYIDGVEKNLKEF